jgi:16S rRNA (cytosine967-C5)-methyltransferase
MSLPNRRRAGAHVDSPPPVPPRRKAGLWSSARTVDKSDGLSARATALEILLRVEQGAFADVLLGHRLPGFNFSDRRLITGLVLGTTAWRARLDYELDRLVREGVERLDLPVRTLLRMGLYQLRFLTRIGAYAAVDTAVTLAKQRDETRAAAGLVNAVLRRAAAHPAPALPEPQAGLVRHLAIRYSHPEWLVERILEWFGESEARLLLARNNEPAPNWIRLNLAHATRQEVLARLCAEGIEVAPFAGLPEAGLLCEALPRETAANVRALFTPQSAASQMVARLLAPEAGAAVLDCAAAPGGKATHLAELTGPGGRVFAIDRRLEGLQAARSLAQRLGHRNISLVCADVVGGLPFRPGSFGFVLLDAPCSGLGTLRSHPEIRWRLAPQDLERLAVLQGRMLESAAAMVKPNGVIVYAVCSFAPTEGVEVVRRFLGQNRDFVVDDTGPKFNKLRLARSAGGFLCLSLSPSRNGLDGFFAVRLRRRSEG